MTKPRILVTGATGKTGAVVAHELIKAGFPVRAMVRGIDARSQALAANGAEIAVADMGDPEAVAAALKDVQRAYFLAPFDPAALEGAAVFATAARDARLEHITLMSQWLASPAHPALSTRHHWLADRLFRMIPDMGLTIVNPGFFADMPYLSIMPYAAQLGVYPWLFGEGRNAPPSVDDIGRVAAASLIDPAQHAGRTYRPTGPTLLSGADVVGVLSRVLDRKVRAVPMPLWMFMRAAKLDGYPLHLLAMMPYYIEEHRRGGFEAGAPTDHVEVVTGRAPESFEMVARRHALLPQNRRTPGAFLARFAKFMAVPLSPGPAVARYRAGLHMPFPPRPAYTLESEVWCAEHGIGHARRDDVAPPRRIEPAVTVPRGTPAKIAAI